MCRHAALTCALLLLCLSSSLQAQRDPGLLELGIPQARPILRGQSQQFGVMLQQDQCAQIVVDQRGVDVLVRVRAPNRFTAEFDSSTGADGPENIRVAAPVAGRYTVEVYAISSAPNANGRFEIRLTNIRPATVQELQEARRPEILRERGVELVHRLVGALPQLKSRFTRLNMQIRAAQMLWPVDERSARRYAMDAAAAVRDYVHQPDPDDTPYAAPYSRASQLRNNMFQLLQQQDPEAALAFLRETRVPGILATHYNAYQDPEIGMETQVAFQLALVQPKRAYDIARETLSRGYSSNLGNVITRLREAAPDLAAALMDETVAKLREESLLAAPEAGNLAVNLLQSARNGAARSANRNAATRPDVPLLAAADYRSLFEKVLAEGLSAEVVPNVYTPEGNAARNMLSSLKGMADDLNKLAPTAAAAVDAKLTQLNSINNPRGHLYNEIINNGSAAVALGEIGRAPRDLRDGLHFQLATKLAANGDFAGARQIAENLIINPQQKQQALDGVQRQIIERALNEGKLHEALENLGRLRTPRERLTMATQMFWRIENNQKPAAAVNFLEQLAAITGLSVPAQGLEQANALVLFARSFARYAPDRGFQVLEPFVAQFNQLADAAVTLNGFGAQYFENGELALNNGNFIGNLANQLGEALARLGVADPDRAAALVGRIERNEVQAAILLAMAQHMITPQDVSYLTWS